VAFCADKDALNTTPEPSTVTRLKVDALALAGGLVLLGYVAGAWFSRSGGIMPSPRVHK
jgi:hypothetical protein